MRSTITRKLTTSIIHADIIDISSGKPVLKHLPPLAVCGKINEDKALKELKKQHGKKSAIKVTRIDEATHQYTCTVDDFIKIAKKHENQD